MWGGAHAMAYVWRSESSCVEWVLFFLLYGGSGDLTQIVRLTLQALTPAKPLCDVSEQLVGRFEGGVQHRILEGQDRTGPS